MEGDCDLCESKREVNWICQECDQTLCNTCKTIHLRVKICQNHHVLPLDKSLQNTGTTGMYVEGDIGKEYCHEHTSEKLQRYCKNCDAPLCIECVFSHHGHQLVKLSEILLVKQQELSDIIKQAKNSRLSKIKISLKEMKEHKDKYITETSNSIEEINKKAEKLKAEVDEIQDNFIQEARSRQQNQTKLFDSCIKRLENELSDIKNAITEAGNQLATTKEISVLNNKIKSIKTLIKNEREITIPSVTTITFTANKSNKNDIQKLYGHLKTKTDHSENDDDDDDRLASDIIREVAISPVQNFTHVHYKEYEGYNWNHEKRYKPQLKSDSTEISQICSYGDKALIISCFQNNEIFSNIQSELKIFYNARAAYKPCFTMLKLVSFDGKVKKEGRLETQIVLGMTTNHEESLFISDGKSEQILMSKDEQFQFQLFVSTKPYTPYNLCCTGRGHLLACLMKSDSKKIVQYTKTARTAQVFELSDKGQTLFKNLTTITVNKHENIWIEDSGKVMALDFKGRIKFTYNGLNGPNKTDLLKNHKLDHEFSPCGMASNEYGDVLICDYHNSIIHVVDSAGNTVDLIKSDKPRHITNDSRNKCLWITSDECKVSVVKYSMY